MQLLMPAEYIKQATAAIRSAKQRVSFICMVLTDDDSTGELINSLAEAARRGVKVWVSGDMFTYTELSGQFIPSHYYSKKVRSTTKMARTLSKAGVKFYWLGRLSATTFTGRTHSKWCVVDDTVFSFGGVNLYDEATKNIDYMLKTTNPALAEALFKEHQRIVNADKKNHSYRSHSIIIDQKSSVLVDAGFFGDSIIYSRACELSENAAHITYISQYCPTGKLSRILHKKSADLYFNSWQSAKGFNSAIIRLGMFLTRQKTSYSRPGYIHAKCMIFEMPDKSKIAITGSHNFVHGGVLLGTREIALETKDESIISQLEDFARQNII